MSRSLWYLPACLQRRLWRTGLGWSLTSCQRCRYEVFVTFSNQGRRIKIHELLGFWDSIRDNRLCGRKDCQYCGYCPGEPVLHLWLGENMLHNLITIELRWILSGGEWQPWGEQGAEKRKREVQSGLWSLSGGGGQTGIFFRDLHFLVICIYVHRWATILAHAGKVACLPKDTSIWRCLSTLLSCFIYASHDWLHFISSTKPIYWL